MVKWLINSRSRYGGSYTAALFVLCSHTFQRLPAKKKKNDDDKRNNRENDRFILFRYIVYILYLYIHRDGEKILCVKENHRRARRRRSGFLACFYFFWLLVTFAINWFNQAAITNDRRFSSCVVTLFSLNRLSLLRVCVCRVSVYCEKSSKADALENEILLPPDLSHAPLPP